MAIYTGIKNRFAIQKASTWGTLVDAGTGDLFPIKSESLTSDTERVENPELNDTVMMSPGDSGKETVGGAKEEPAGADGRSRRKREVGGQAAELARRRRHEELGEEDARADGEGQREGGADPWGGGAELSGGRGAATAQTCTPLPIRS